MEKRNTLSENFPKLLAVAVGCAIAWSAVEPYNWGVWYVEISSVLLVYFILIFTYGKFRFSNMSYFIVSLWLMMHAVGARYSFELVPFGLVSDLFGFERNHYDRVAHFVVGMNSYGAAEFFLRKGFACGRRFAAFAGILFIMALANAWELIEWGLCRSALSISSHRESERMRVPSRSTHKFSAFLGIYRKMKWIMRK